MCFVLFVFLPNQLLKMSANAKPALPGYIKTERDFSKRNSISWPRIAISLLLLWPLSLCNSQMLRE